MHTTNSKHGLPVAPNQLDRQFRIEQIKGLDEACAGDITSIPATGSWLYLAVVLDLKSRRVIGWSMGDTMEQSLVQDALRTATDLRLGHGKAEGDLLFHSGRGSRHASRAFQAQLARVAISARMSRKGNSWDNAPAESFFATLKKELVYRQTFLNRERARASFVRVHRNLLQSNPAAFRLGQPQPRRIRTTTP